MIRLLCLKELMSEGVDWYFPGISFRFQPEVCDVWHDLMQKVLDFNSVAIVSVKENYYKDEAINLLENVDFS